jgi:aryl-alcohol dehydrogenase-like predicted oxidoreductase
MNTSICLGTVQFGADYGITNKSGKVSEKLVKNILVHAEKNNIKYLDTAQSYGDAEEVLGRIKKRDSRFKIISKLSSLENLDITKETINKLEKRFNKTLNNLECKSIYSFLIHNSNDLKRKNSDLLFEWLESLLKRSLVKKIGLSIYDLKELEEIPIKKINLIQLPLSIYNQNALKDGYLRKLSEEGILIHARSVFLQGLLLNSSKSWPKYFSEEFKKHHLKTELLSKEMEISLLDLCLGFIKKLPFLDSLVIGVTSMEELNQIIYSWNKENLDFANIDFNKLSWNNTYDLDPRNWTNK